jgi:hypothetical protein
MRVGESKRIASVGPLQRRSRACFGYTQAQRTHGRRLMLTIGKRSAHLQKLDLVQASAVLKV